MTCSIPEILDRLRQQFSPEISVVSGEFAVPLCADMHTNTHIHLPPNFSAFDSVEQAIAQASEQDVRVLGVSNYYDFEVYADFAVRARSAEIIPLFGVEIICRDAALAAAGIRVNDPGNPGKIYLCGKGISRFAPPLSAYADQTMSLIRERDSRRMALMVKRLNEAMAAGGLEAQLDAQALIDRIAARHAVAPRTVCLQERHVAQMCQEILFEQLPVGSRRQRLASFLGLASPAEAEDATCVQDRIRSRLMKSGMPAYVEEDFIDMQEAYAFVLELGGIPCYPVLADGAAAICEFEQSVETLITQLRERQFHAAEFIPGRNSPDLLREYVTAMRRAGLVVSAGTEHNTLAPLPLKPACRGGAAIPEEVQSIFHEGACVAVAHQFLRLHDKEGFVDQQGRPNPRFTSADERIGAFARTGEAIIRQMLDTQPAVQGES